MKVPFVDLKSQYRNFQAEMDAAIRSVIEDTAFIGGKYVRKFEEEFAARYGVKHCIGVGNGTDAIYLALKGLGIGPGDEVITVANSWISTSETITQAGARPVFVDIDPDYYHIDPTQIEGKITPKTRAILPVHLYGQACDMAALAAISKKHGLHLVEDCAQSHFAEFGGRRTGTFGAAGTFSFYPGKNLGGYGDGGAVVTDDDRLATFVRMYANHGCLVKHQHEMEGINSRLDGIQSAILSVKLKYITDWNKKRYENALFYNEILKDREEIVTPKLRPGATHIFHLYVIRTPRREELIRFLAERGIETGLHYPVALPLMKAYAYLGHRSQDFPVIAKYQHEILSLPMFPELTREQMSAVAEGIRDFFKTR